jgi:hypothetical protein
MDMKCVSNLVSFEILGAVIGNSLIFSSVLFSQPRLADQSVMGLGEVFLWLLLLAGAPVARSYGERELSVLTWNVNGVKKFQSLPAEQSFFAQHDVILLQETFAYDDNDLFELVGYLGHHARAIPTDHGRNIWGQTTLFRTTSFADGFLEKLYSPCDWVLVSRWRQEGVPGLIVMNVYVPLHSRCAIVMEFS